MATPWEVFVCCAMILFVIRHVVHILACCGFECSYMLAVGDGVRDSYVHVVMVVVVVLCAHMIWLWWYVCEV